MLRGIKMIWKNCARSISCKRCIVPPVDIFTKKCYSKFAYMTDGSGIDHREYKGNGRPSGQERSSDCRLFFFYRKS